jgi:hypothetical protein
MNKIQYIFEYTLRDMINEQEAADAKGAPKETDNAPKSSTDSPFTPAEEKFLGKFDAYGTTHIGIIYSTSDIGVREFMARSGNDLNLTPGILLNLLRNKIVKIVPYTGFGRNNDYTIELQLSLDDVAGLGAEDKEKAEKGGAGGGAAAAAPEAAPAPEVAWVVKYGDILRESVNITKKLISEKKSTKTEKPTVYVDDSRMLKRVPKDYIYHLERIIKMFGVKTKNSSEKQRLLADILDNLQVNLKLSPKQIQKSYEFHKTQKRLQKILDKNK